MKELFMKDWSLKLIAIGSALIFWFIILGLQNAPQDFGVPLEIKPFNLSEQYTVVGALPSANVKILADKEVQRQLRPDDLEIYIDLKNVEPGKVTSAVYVTSKNPKVTVVSVEPESVTMTIEKRVEREVVLDYVVTGKASSNSEVKSVKASPERVTLSGAASILSGLKKVRILVPLTGGEDRSFVLNRATLVDQDGKPLQGVKIAPEEIDADVEIISTQQEKIVPIKPRLTGALTSGFLTKISVKPTVMSVQGDAKLLDTISALDMEAIDLSKVTKTGWYSSSVILPKDLRTATGTKVDLYLEISDVK
jgi:YbbR domain-containing protein